MANNLTTFDELNKMIYAWFQKTKNVPLKETNWLREKLFIRKDTGMAHKIANIYHANIEHYNLICCSETNSSCLLSKFALDKDYSEDSVKIENFGLKMLKRLSEMWG